MKMKMMMCLHIQGFAGFSIYSAVSVLEIGCSGNTLLFFHN
jgi:hypothetical protein